MKRDRKRTDERDAEQAMAPELAAIEQRWLDQEADAAEHERYLREDPMAHALGDLLAGVPGVTVIDLATGEPWPEPPRELPEEG
jgi:hypothetical protein